MQASTALCQVVWCGGGRGLGGTAHQVGGGRPPSVGFCFWEHAVVLSAVPAAWESLYTSCSHRASRSSSQRPRCFPGSFSWSFPWEAIPAEPALTRGKHPFPWDYSLQAGNQIKPPGDSPAQDLCPSPGMPPPLLRVSVPASTLHTGQAPPCHPSDQTLGSPVLSALRGHPTSSFGETSALSLSPPAAPMALVSNSRIAAETSTGKVH